MKKRILTALLATSMVLASAPTAFAADPEVVLDPLGIVYEMGDDNILTETDGEIDHGDSVYLLLVDESNGDPSELKSDDVRSLRVYTEWEVGESRVNDEDILYKKAEDVRVSSSAVPDTTYALNVTLTMPGASAPFAVVQGVTQAGGVGWTADEIAALDAADLANIADLALAAFKASGESGDAAQLAAYQKAMLSINGYKELTNPYVYGSKAYATENDLLSGGIQKLDASSFYQYPPTNPTHYTDDPADATAGYIEITTPIGMWNGNYYATLEAAEAAEFAANTDIQPLPAGTYHDGSTVYIGYTETSGHYIITDDPTTPLYKNADLVDEAGLATLAEGDVISAVAVLGITGLKIWVTDVTVHGDTVAVATTQPADHPVDGPYTEGSSISDSVFLEKNADGTFTYLNSGYTRTNVAAIYNGTSYVTGASLSADADNRYDRITNTFYANEAAALAAFTSTATEITSGYYQTEPGGQITLHKTAAELYEAISGTHYALATANFPLAVGDTLVITRPATAWVDSSDIVLTDITTAVDTAYAQAVAGATATVAQGAVAGTSTTSTRAGTVTLAGPDYYYFVEIDTKTYSGANEYDLVGFVSVGTSRNDAEDKGSSEIAVVLTAGNYDGGTPQSGDIDIYGENNAIVEFEDDADEIYILWDNEAMFIVDVDGQDELNLGYNTDFNSTFADRHGYANIDFLNFVAQPRFNRTGEFYIYADEDMYIYQLNDEGFAEEINGLDYDEDEEAWNFRTNHLTSYVIADEELVLTDEHGDFLEPDDATEQPPVIGKPNPGTGR